MAYRNAEGNGRCDEERQMKTYDEMWHELIQASRIDPLARDMMCADLLSPTPRETLLLMLSVAMAERHQVVMKELSKAISLQPPPPFAIHGSIDLLEVIRIQHKALERLSNQQIGFDGPEEIAVANAALEAGRPWAVIRPER
jgi:hypothetical protein